MIEGTEVRIRLLADVNGLRKGEVHVARETCPPPGFGGWAGYEIPGLARGKRGRLIHETQAEIIG